MLEANRLLELEKLFNALILWIAALLIFIAGPVMFLTSLGVYVSVNMALQFAICASFYALWLFLGPTKL